MTRWTQALLSDIDHAARLATDLPFAAAELLRIRPKSGGLVPLIFNDAQRELHRQLEEQKRDTGKVRAIIVKSRQQGSSTYTTARHFRLVTANPGTRCQIVTHESAATRNLFAIVKRYNEHLPPEHKLNVTTDNAESLVFGNDSGYMVATASTEDVGRSGTANYLHCSESAFYHDLQAQLASLFQVLPEEPGTEAIIESTPLSYGDAFHQFFLKAQSGENGYKAIFIPWTLTREYAALLPEGFELTDEEKELIALHGLTREQCAWRRQKVAIMGTEMFEREYSLDAASAFQQSAFDSFIPPQLVLRARKENNLEAYGPLILGVDVARFGPDATCCAWRRGRVITKIEKRRGLSTMEVAGWIGELIREEKPARVNIDVGGLGAGVVDRLLEQNYGELIGSINFGSSPIVPPPLDEQGKPSGGPKNRRAEMYSNLKKLLEGRFSLPDSNALQSDLCAPGYSYDSSSKLVLESKIDIKKRLGMSPDEGDAVALTCAEPNGAPIPRSVATNFNRKLEYSNAGLA
jgi:hypothetical protein